MHWKIISSSSVGGYGLCIQWGQCWLEFHACKQCPPHFSKTCSVPPGEQVYLLSVFSNDWRKNNHLVLTQQWPTGWIDFKKKCQMQTQLNGMPWKSISRSFPMVFIKSKQRIWSTGIIVAWTPAFYICPESMWKAAIIFKVPTPPHRPGNLCYHLLWWIICWCYYRWWFRMCCLINELQPCMNLKNEVQ